jgi:hypothetical protein
LSNTLKLIEKEKVKHVKFEKETTKNKILEQIKPLTFTIIIERDKSISRLEPIGSYEKNLI